jgi:dienelactone hydrolase
MHSRLLPAALAFAIAAPAAAAGESVDPFTRAYVQPDLIFPEKPQRFGRALDDLFFKPDGDGPFPALVIMPTCQPVSSQTHDWAERALAHRYAVLIVEPLRPRGERSNCGGRPAPVPVPNSRLLKDAFDAANHLRRQLFIDPARIGLLGFSQGGNVALGASVGSYSHLDGSKPFAAIVAFYPFCILRNYAQSGIVPYPVDMHYVPDRVVVPILVELGDKDRELDQVMGNCPLVLDQQKALGAPVEYIVYHATHIWDQREATPPTYTYDPEVTKKSVLDAFAFLDARLKP